MQRPLKLLVTAALGAASLTGVIACGSSSSGSASTTTPATTTAPATDPATTAPDPAAPAATHADGTLVTMTEGKPTEFGMQMDRMAAPAGAVTFKVTNAGKLVHEMVVIKTNLKAANLPKDKTGKASEAGSIGETGDVKPGETKTVVFHLKKGHYALICNLPGHYVGGMRMDFTVN